MKIRLITTICTIASAMMAAAQVPSLINYQGRLSDASGAPVTGSKNFSISIYDAATAGNLLYTETIGAVTLDANGVYSFQFGGTGTSNSQVTETLGTTDAATLIYTKALANTGIVENSITVTDGTNTWSQSVGNPGVGATATANTIVGFVIGATITNGGSGYTSPPVVTIIGNGSGAAATAVLTEGVVTGITITSAGSGYTGTPTITIAPPVIPFRVDYNSGIITATYSATPASGRTITATYRYGTSGITGALSSGAEHWMTVSVDSVVQGTRQRVLAVPFAQTAKLALEAVSLQKTEKQIILASWDVREHSATNNLRNNIILNPVTNQGQGLVLFRRIDPSIKKILGITTHVQIFNEPAGYAVLELMKVNKEGVETTAVELRRDGTTGELIYSDPINLDWDQNDYYFRLNYSGYYDGSRGRFGDAKLKPVVIRYLE